MVDDICAERPRGRLIEGQEHDAGKDAEGRALWVMAINSDEEPDEEPDESEGQDAEVGSTAEEDDEDGESITTTGRILLEVGSTAGEDDEDGDDDEGAEDDETREYWVGVFDDEDLLSLTQVETVYFDREDRETDWAIPNSSSEYREDLLAFRAGTFESLPVCNEEGFPDVDGVFAGRAYLYIPAMSLPVSYREGGWKTTFPPCAVSLGASSALPMTELDSGSLDEMTVPPGFLTHGAPDSASDGAMRVLMGDSRTPYVEVHDDTWVTAGKNWLHTDHLEIWSGPPLVKFRKQACLPNRRSSDVVQWGVRMDSGAVISAYDKPRPPNQQLVRPIAYRERLGRLLRSHRAICCKKQGDRVSAHYAVMTSGSCPNTSTSDTSSAASSSCRTRPGSSPMPPLPSLRISTCSHLRT